MKEIKNFLTMEKFKELQNLIFDINFPWRIRSEMTSLDKHIFFGHIFFDSLEPRSEYYYSHIIPILKKINCKSPIQIRTNMFINKLFDKSGWHVDHEKYEEKNEHTTAILYLNNCNGGTEFKIKNKIKFIKAEENKIVIFSSRTEHRAITSTNTDIRYIINFNYYETK
jgi:hypothetical protein